MKDRGEGLLSIRKNKKNKRRLGGSFVRALGGEGFSLAEHGSISLVELYLEPTPEGNPLKRSE